MLYVVLHGQAGIAVPVHLVKQRTLQHFAVLVGLLSLLIASLAIVSL